MAKVTLAKALKIKNRIASRITTARKQVCGHNAFIVNKDIPVDEIKLQVNVKETIKEMNKLTDALVSVKSEITKSNNKVAHLIYEMSEIKGLINFYKELDCSEQLTYHSMFGKQNDDVKRVQISISERDAIVMSLTKSVEKIQDELDEYNATSYINIHDQILEL
jgi:hypothetical protein